MIEFDMIAILELQYLAVQELLDELERMPTRDEVTDRVATFISAKEDSTLRLVQ